MQNDCFVRLSQNTYQLLFVTTNQQMPYQTSANSYFNRSREKQLKEAFECKIAGCEKP
jgi:hypothetical protein